MRLRKFLCNAGSARLPLEHAARKALGWEAAGVPGHRRRKETAWLVCRRTRQERAGARAGGSARPGKPQVTLGGGS
jgi:hypothetical protein